MWRGKVLAVLLVALTGCAQSDVDIFRCRDPDLVHLAADGRPDPCHFRDPPPDAGAPGDGGDACPGACVPVNPDGWRGPTLVWMGAEADAPACPGTAPVETFTDRRPLAVQPCATICTCDPPAGWCARPATLTAAASSCADDGLGVAHTSFDPPASWTGTCTAENAIPPAKLCGGAPCVQSVTIAPLTVTESDCLPIEHPNISPPPWGTFARGCAATSYPPLCTPTGGLLCVPAAPGPEFQQCVFQQGVPSVLPALPCPPSYPARSVFYGAFVDNRHCAGTCACGAPKDSTCTGSIGLFSDATCNAPLVGPTISIDAEGTKCLDVPQGSALGSKSASEPIYKPGKCPVTGGQQGEIDSTLARVICCQGTSPPL